MGFANTVRDAPPRGGLSIEGAEAMRRAGERLAVAAIAIGLLALIGWVTGSEVLKSMIPGEATMKPNTAIAVVLLGVAAISIGRRRRRLGYLAAGVATGIGAITLIEYLSGRNAGIDTLIFGHGVATLGSPDPGRMAPNSAAAFVACGLGLLAWEIRVRHYAPTNLLMLVGATIALLALVGYSARVEDLFGLSDTVTSMALPSASAIFLVSISVLLLRPERGIVRTIAMGGAGGQALRALLPVVVLGPVALGLLISRLERSEVIDPRVGLWLLNVALVLGFTAVALALGRRLAAIDEQRREQVEVALHSSALHERAEDRARELAADLASIAEVTRELARSTDSETARTVICEAAAKLAGAPLAALFEPAPDGRGLLVTARTVAVQEAEESAFVSGDGAARAFVGGERVFEPDRGSRGEPSALGDNAAAAAWQPVMRGPAAIGVLAVGWERAIDSLPERTAGGLEMLAAEASVAIDRAALLSRLEAMARTDDLTGLPNRRAWDQTLSRERARSVRTGEPLCLAMIDLDHFKQYNDLRGHLAGDRILRQAAAAWQAELRLTDTLARYGGEEFGLLLPGCDAQDAMPMLERIRGATPAGLTCSAGIAEWDRAESIDALTGRADQALYQAKRRGRDRSVCALVQGDQERSGPVR